MVGLKLQRHFNGFGIYEFRLLVLHVLPCNFQLAVEQYSSEVQPAYPLCLSRAAVKQHVVGFTSEDLHSRRRPGTAFLPEGGGESRPLASLFASLTSATGGSARSLPMCSMFETSLLDQAIVLLRINLGRHDTVTPTNTLAPHPHPSPALWGKNPPALPQTLDPETP